MRRGGPGPTRGLGDGPMEGKRRFGGHWREEKASPASGWLWSPQLSQGSEAVGGIHTRAPLLSLLWVAEETEELVGVAGGVPALGLSGSVAGLGASALREERQQQGFCRLWAGAGSSSAAVMATECSMGRPRGPLRSGRVPGFSSTGRYCTEQEEVPIGAQGDRASSFFLPAAFTLQGDGFVPGLVPREEGLARG